MKVLAQFQISHINIRREKAGEEEGDLGCDISLKSTVKADAVASFFSTESSRRRVLDDLWNEDGELTTTDVSKIGLTTKIEGGTLSLKSEFSAAESFDPANLNKVSIVPIAGGMVEVSMRAQVNPTSEQLGRLSNLLGCEVHVIADRKQGELELQAPTSEDEKDDVEAEGSVVPGQPAPQRPKRSKPGATIQ